MATATATSMADKAQVSQVETKTRELQQQVNSLKVTNAAECIKAGDMLKIVVSMKREVQATFRPIIDAAHKAHREACGAEKKHLQPLEEAERQLKSGILAYQRAQEEARMREEARLREISRKQEEDRRVEEAAELEREGFKEAAAAMIEEPIYEHAVVVESSVPKIDGISTRRGKWRCAIDDKRAALQAVLDGKLAIETLEFNQSALDKLADVFKTSMNIPGLRSYQDAGVVSVRV